MLALRLLEDDKELLDGLVRKRSEELADVGGTVSASSVVRSLIRKAAADEGIKPGRPKQKP